jgi:hypothetical protein
MRRRVLALAVACWSTIGVPHAQDSSGPGAFTLLRTLTGDWEGSFQWIGVPADAGPSTATYALISNGSAMMETLMIGGSTMTSVYHLDGSALRMTHYCAAANQPRLKAQRIDLAHGSIDFEFVDITNLRSPDATHVHGFEIRVTDSDHLKLAFVVKSGDQQRREQITLTRKR